MIVIKIDAQLFWTILSGIGGLAGVFALLITIAKNRQKKREELERSCDEWCAAISNSKIHTLLNNIIAICDKGTDDAKSIIEVQNELKQIFHEVSTKWDAVKSKLNAKKQKELLEKLETVFHDYQSYAKDAETIVIALGLGNVEEVKRFLSNNNSQEIRDIVHTTSELFENDLQGFIKQIISLRFKDLDIPDYASQIRVLMKESYQDKNVLETQLLARIGDARAQYALGNYYYNQKQFKKAFSWYKKSAEQALAKAQCNLGACYDAGEGCEQDYNKAFEWFMKSADQGDALAQRAIGLYYYIGIEKGCEQDYNKAFEWLKKSAEQGLADAQFNLGVCYDKGKGCDQDSNKAFEWFKKSAEQGFALSQGMLGFCYYFRQGCEQDYNKAFEWFKKSAEQGEPMSQRCLGLCYRDGDGCEQDYNKAFEWLKKSAEQGLANAQFHLGVCYAKGKGCDTDKYKAFEWYNKSAEQGCVEAQYNLGVCYYKGEGCDQDYNKAFHWYTSASQDKQDVDNYSKSIYMIGVMYFNGEIGLGDYFTAVNYFKIAAQYGHALAQYQLGYCYENGIGVKEVDLEEAKYWYGEAAKQGDAEAIESLKRLEKSE